jgi:hypothetical protein
MRERGKGAMRISGSVARAAVRMYGWPLPFAFLLAFVGCSPRSMVVANASEVWQCAPGAIQVISETPESGYAAGTSYVLRGCGNTGTATCRHVPGSDGNDLLLCTAPPSRYGKAGGTLEMGAFGMGEEYYPTFGPIVIGVRPGSPADIAGIRGGDIIIDVDGHYVGDLNGTLRITDLVRAAGKHVIHVKRGVTEIDLAFDWGAR